jgi:subtilisin-like proprotein convertase family protein/subtilisin family serine protease
MPEQDKDYYYAMGKKVKLSRLPDSLALRYKEGVPAKAMGTKLAEMEGFADAEERKEMPKHRLVIVTLPHTRRLGDVRASLENLERDEQVEFVVPVYREPESGLRMIATDEITVRFKSSASQAEIDQFNRENGTEVVKKNRFVPSQYILRVKNAQDTLAIANKYQESDLTEFAAPNFVSEVKKYALTNDQFIQQQWHLKNTGQGGGLAGEDVNAEQCWTLTEGSPDIIIAIIDDGVDIDHPDLKDNIWKNANPSEPDVHGWDFYNDNNDPRPKRFTPPYHRLEGNDSHGTPCAGVAAAAGNNTLGVAGIAYKCKILPVKIFMADDLITMNVLADAIRYAGQRAAVLSNSWGIPPDPNVAQAIKDVVQTGRNGKGCPVFVAAGNSSSSSIGFPASVPEAIAVGASTNQGLRAGYSQYGTGLDFVAPSNGGTLGIFTTDVSIPGRGFNIGNINSGDAQGLYTNSFGGTSSATPLAAGVAALILSLNKKLTWTQVRQYMRKTADKIDQALGNYINGISFEYGFGRINAHKALQAVKDDMEGPDKRQLIEEKVSPGLAIPDKNLAGVVSAIDIGEDGSIDSVEEISVNITHAYRGDLLVSLITPDNTEIKLHEGQGGGADNLIATYHSGNTPVFQQLQGKGVRGQWLLKVVDRWAQDTGTLNNWGLKIWMLSSLVRGTAAPAMHIPDKVPGGITSTIKIEAPGQKVQGITVAVDISHSYIQDLSVTLASPTGKTVALHDRTGGNQDNIQQEYTMTTHPQLGQLLGEDVSGDWQLLVADHVGLDIGKLNQWEVEIRV